MDVFKHLVLETFTFSSFNMWNNPQSISNILTHSKRMISPDTMYQLSGVNMGLLLSKIMQVMRDTV